MILPQNEPEQLLTLIKALPLSLLVTLTSSPFRGSSMEPSSLAWFQTHDDPAWIPKTTLGCCAFESQPYVLSQSNSQCPPRAEPTVWVPCWLQTSHIHLGVFSSLLPSRAKTKGLFANRYGGSEKQRHSDPGSRLPFDTHQEHHASSSLSSCCASV